MREDPPLEVTVATVVAERQASAGAHDGVKGQRRTLAVRAPLHAIVRRSSLEWPGTCEEPAEGERVRAGSE